MKPRFLLSSSLFVSLSFLAACGGGETVAATVDATLGLPVMTRPASWTEGKAALGKLLFFDGRLSSDGQMSCATCHVHELGWTDGKQFSAKVDGKLNTRNSPSLYNVAYQPHFYWDGRAPSLEANITAAWKGHMRGGADATEAVAAIAAVAGYAKDFQAAFGAAPGETSIVEALASFVRSLQSGGSRYDRFQGGKKDALTADEQAGMQLFQQACVICHAGALLTDHQFHNVGIGMTAETPDPGRNKVDTRAAPSSFKTPSLRSVSKTAPYFHDGSVATLEEAVRIRATGGIANPYLDPLMAPVKAKNFTADDISKIVAFLKSLASEESFTNPTLPQ